MHILGQAGQVRVTATQFLHPPTSFPEKTPLERGAACCGRARLRMWGGGRARPRRCRGSGGLGRGTGSLAPAAFSPVAWPPSSAGPTRPSQVSCVMSLREIEKLRPQVISTRKWNASQWILQCHNTRQCFSPDLRFNIVVYFISIISQYNSARSLQLDRDQVSVMSTFWTNLLQDTRLYWSPLS